LDFKNALTVSHQGQRAVDIKQLQRSESTMMMMLNEITVRDAVGVKILTIVATLYLPASFVAVSFEPFYIINIALYALLTLVRILIRLF
jgi:hypothetical protein